MHGSFWMMLIRFHVSKDKQELEKKTFYVKEQFQTLPVLTNVANPLPPSLSLFFVLYKVSSFKSLVFSSSIHVVDRLSGRTENHGDTHIDRGQLPLLFVIPLHTTINNQP